MKILVWLTLDPPDIITLTDTSPDDSDPLKVVEVK